MKKLLFLMPLMLIVAACSSHQVSNHSHQQDQIHPSQIEKNILTEVPKIRLAEKMLDRSNNCPNAADSNQPCNTHPVITSWNATKGQTLKEVIIGWSAQEKCAQGGTWFVNWLTPINYPITASFNFNGSYRRAINQVFRIYANADNPLYVKAFEPQCLLVVQDKP